MPNREDYAKARAALAVVHKVLDDFRSVGIIRDGLSDTQMGMAISEAAQHIEDDVKFTAD